MMRLRNAATNVQVVVPDAKAVRLIASGDYEAVPDADQPPPGTGERKPAPERKGQGHTSIAGALMAAAGPMWDTPAI